MLFSQIACTNIVLPGPRKMPGDPSPAAPRQIKALIEEHCAIPFYLKESITTKYLHYRIGMCGWVYCCQISETNLAVPTINICKLFRIPWALNFCPSLQSSSCWYIITEGICSWLTLLPCLNNFAFYRSACTEKLCSPLFSFTSTSFALLAYVLCMNVWRSVLNI